MSSKQIVRNRRMAAIRQGWHCFYCHVSILHKYTADHKIPKAAGGTDRYTNIVAACIECNRRKRKMSVEEYFASDELFDLLRKRGLICEIAAYRRRRARRTGDNQCQDPSTKPEKTLPASD